jgi:hypothetical protein
MIGGIIGLGEGLIECVNNNDYRAGRHKPNQKIVIGTDDDIAAAIYGSRKTEKLHARLQAFASRTARVTRLAINGILNPL